jgi:hypothetical protein
VFKIVARDNVRALANRAFVSAIQICSAIAGRDGIVGSGFAIAHARLAHHYGQAAQAGGVRCDGACALGASSVGRELQQSQGLPSPNWKLQ